MPVEIILFQQDPLNLYSLSKEIIVKNSTLVKDLLLKEQQGENRIIITISDGLIVDNFINFVKGEIVLLDDVYQEFKVHSFFDTNHYFEFLLKELVKSGKIKHDKIKELGDDNLSWEIYKNLPLPLVREDLLTPEFIESYYNNSDSDRINFHPYYFTSLGKMNIFTLNADQLKDGIEISWWDEERKKMKHRMFWNGGLPDGIMEKWYQNGNLELRKHYLDAKLVKEETWDCMGNLIRRLTNLDDSNSVEEKWYNNGVPEKVVRRKGTQLHGCQESWYINGFRKKRLMMIGGKGNGVLEEWHPNGFISKVILLVNDCYHGTEQIWYDNGNIKETINWKNGKKNGIAMGWYRNNKRSYRAVWKNNLLCGQHMRWTVNGREK